MYIPVSPFSTVWSRAVGVVVIERLRASSRIFQASQDMTLKESTVRTALGNQLLFTGQSRVTCNWVSFGLIRVSGELSKSDVIGEELRVLPPEYSACEGRLAYNEEWDETAELQSDSEEE